MLTSLFVMLAVGPATLDKGEPATKELFAGEEWYKKQAGKEQDFVGTLEKVDRGGRVGFGRSNPYRLKMKGDTREVYVGGKPNLLAPYVGKTVKLTGKAVDIEVEGNKHREIWPARVQLVKGDKTKGSFRFQELPPAQTYPPLRTALAATAPLAFKVAEDKTKDKELKIQARGFWRAPAKPGAAAQQLAFRHPGEAAKAMGLTGDGRSRIQATRMLAQALKVPSIDWDKQMVVVVTAGAKPTGGYSVEITSLSVKDKTLTVHWKLKSPGPGSIVTQAFTHPAQAVLTERFEGEVKFDPPAKGK
jgi:hypothetical protein